VRATSTTSPPAAPIFSAVACPMPDEAPVIRTVRPFTASGSDGASTSPAPGIRRPNARAVRATVPTNSPGLRAAIARNATTG
jgi:hypothetical protein